MHETFRYSHNLKVLPTRKQISPREQHSSSQKRNKMLLRVATWILCVVFGRSWYSCRRPRLVIAIYHRYHHAPLVCMAAQPLAKLRIRVRFPLMVHHIFSVPDLSLGTDWSPCYSKEARRKSRIVVSLLSATLSSQTSPVRVSPSKEHKSAKSVMRSNPKQCSEMRERERKRNKERERERKRERKREGERERGRTNKTLLAGLSSPSCNPPRQSEKARGKPRTVIRLLSATALPFVELLERATGLLLRSFVDLITVSRLHHHHNAGNAQSRSEPHGLHGAFEKTRCG